MASSALSMNTGGDITVRGANRRQAPLVLFGNLQNVGDHLPAESAGIWHVVSLGLLLFCFSR